MAGLPVLALQAVLLVTLLTPSHVAAQSASADDRIRINCGGDTYTDVLGRVWEADIHFQGGQSMTFTEFPTLEAVNLLNATSFGNARLLQTFRYWPEGENNSYVIPVTGTSGSRLYWVRLYFAELEYAMPWQRLFSIAINTVLVQQDYNVFDGAFTTRWQEYSVPVVGSNITITFMRGVDSASEHPYVNAIEITPAATTQLHDMFTTAQGPVILSSWTRYSNGGNWTAADDIGRLWGYDTGTILYSNPNTSNRYATANVSGTGVPPGLYSQGTYSSFVEVSAGNVTPAGLSAQYPLGNVGDYLVVLHFADFVYKKSGDRVMDIDLQGKPVKQGLDVVQEAGFNTALALPFIFQNTEVTVGLGLKILPSAISTHQEPMLNAIELFEVIYVNPQIKETAAKTKTALTVGVIAAIAVGVLCLILLAMLGVLIWWQRRLEHMYRIEHGPGGAELLRNLHDRAVRFIPLKEITAATSKWSEAQLLGAGGFGAVYRGEHSGQLWAVKRAKKASLSSLADFITEVDMISQLHHVNLVRLIGFCTERGEQIFVYEFCSNGTVHDYIKPTSSRPPLSFEQRIRIAVGSARGLNYLHSFAKEPLIHRDIKSENILLDADWQAKVADFGLLKRIETEPQRAKTAKIAGTRGYMDPEYYATSQVTDKSDVYSFGVLLLELITGQLPILVNKEDPDSTKTLVAWTRPLAAAARWDLLADPRFGDQYNWEALKQVVELALACVRQYGHERPPMSSVVRGLEKILQSDLSPKGPMPVRNPSDPAPPSSRPSSSSAPQGSRGTSRHASENGGRSSTSPLPSSSQGRASGAQSSVNEGAGSVVFSDVFAR